MDLIKTALVAVIGGVVGAAALESVHRYVPAKSATGELQAMMRDYIVNHPEVLQEAMAEFEKRQQVAETEKARSAVKGNSEAIFNSPRQVTVGDRKGDVTLVEFFDYNCGYCKQALGDLNALMQSDLSLIHI